MSSLILSVVFAASVCASSPDAVLLEWNLPPEKRLEVVKTAHVDYYENAVLVRSYEERNIIDLTSYQQIPSGSRVKGIITLYARNEGSPVFRKNEQYMTDFFIARNGHYDVAKKYTMPNLRHVPTFSEETVKVGSTWSAPVYLVVTGFSAPLTLLLEAKYTLTELKVVNGRRVAVIKYKFPMDKDLPRNRFPADFPLRIAGGEDAVLTWDIDAHEPLASHENYKAVFIFQTPSGLQSIAYRMSIDSDYHIYDSVPTDALARERKTLEDALPKTAGITVGNDPRGLVVNLGELLFDIDSSVLKDSSRPVLDQIVSVLKSRYPGREIIIEGHTDNTGDAAYNKQLSIKRAERVAECVKKNTGSDKVSYEGYGSEKPAADNATREGRQKKPAC